MNQEDNGHVEGEANRMEDNLRGFYYELWKDYSISEYEVGMRRLIERFEINGLDLRGIVNGKKCLDIGCGSGVYSYALAQLGARKIIGLDHAAPPIRLEKFEWNNGDALDIPFGGEEFEFVFSSGVLHHTKDWRKGVSEIYRVLKKDSWAYIYIPGEHWTYYEADKLRSKFTYNDAVVLKEVLKARGWGMGKIYFLLDLFFTPFRVYIRREDFEQELGRYFKIVKLEKDIENRSDIHMRYICQKRQTVKN